MLLGDVSYNVPSMSVFSYGDGMGVSELLVKYLC